MTLNLCLDFTTNFNISMKLLFFLTIIRKTHVNDVNELHYMDESGHTNVKLGHVYSSMLLNFVHVILFNMLLN
jgi:hypothetical protein